MSSGSVATTGESLRSFVDAVEIDGPLPLEKRNGKRSDPRRTLIVPVCVRDIAKSHFESGNMCRLRDVTDWGLGIRSQIPFRIGKIVWIDLRVNNATWSGAMRVVHCTQTLGGYKVGLVIAEGVLTRQTSASKAKTEPNGKDPSDPTPQLRKSLREREWLVQAKAEIQEAIQAYELARRSWGLLGVSVRKEIRRVVNSLPGTVDTAADRRRKHPRIRTGADVRALACVNGSWRRLPARIADVSEDGVGLVLPYDMGQGDTERELAGDTKVHAGMVVILGLGTGSNTLWVPAEVLHCQESADDKVRVGARFLTPRSLDVIEGE